MASSTGPLNLLKHVDLQRGRRGGIWKFEGDILTVDSDPGSPHNYSLRASVPVPLAYRMTLEFSRPKSDSQSISLGLPLPGTQCVHYVADTSAAGRCGFDRWGDDVRGPRLTVFHDDEVRRRFRRFVLIP